MTIRIKPELLFEGRLYIRTSANRKFCFLFIQIFKMLLLSIVFFRFLFLYKYLFYLVLVLSGDKLLRFLVMVRRLSFKEFKQEVGDCGAPIDMQRAFFELMFYRQISTMHSPSLLNK